MPGPSHDDEVGNGPVPCPSARREEPRDGTRYRARAPYEGQGQPAVMLAHTWGSRSGESEGSSCGRERTNQIGLLFCDRVLDRDLHLSRAKAGAVDVDISSVVGEPVRPFRSGRPAPVGKIANLLIGATISSSPPSPPMKSCPAGRAGRMPPKPAWGSAATLATVRHRGLMAVLL